LQKILSQAITIENKEQITLQLFYHVEKYTVLSLHQNKKELPHHLILI